PPLLWWSPCWRALAPPCPPESPQARSLSSRAGSAPRSGVTIRSTNKPAAPRSPPRTRSGRRSFAETGRGAPGQPFTAVAPESASAALSGASTSESTVGPRTTEASGAEAARRGAGRSRPAVHGCGPGERLGGALRGLDERVHGVAQDDGGVRCEGVEHRGRDLPRGLEPTGEDDDEAGALDHRQRVPAG